MEIDAFLADTVDTVNGKIYAHGAGWNMINAQTLPWRQPRIGIGILVRVPYTATNQSHELQIRLQDADGKELQLGGPIATGPDGQPVVRVDAQFNVGRPPHLDPGDDQTLPWSLNFDGLVFEKADQYVFVLSIDGTDIKRLPMWLSHQPFTKPIGR